MPVSFRHSRGPRVSLPSALRVFVFEEFNVQRKTFPWALACRVPLALFGLFCGFRTIQIESSPEWKRETSSVAAGDSSDALRELERRIALNGALAFGAILLACVWEILDEPEESIASPNREAAPSAP